MKHISKGQDLYDASAELEILKDTLKMLKDCIDLHKERLEKTRVRLEGAVRLHELLESHRLKPHDDAMQIELLKLAEQIEVSALIEQCKKILQPPPPASSASINSNKDTNTTSTSDNISLDISLSDDTITATSTPEKGKFGQQLPPPTLIEPNGNRCIHNNHGHHHQDEDEEEQSKMADSGLGSCDRCEGNEKLERTCSCQSLNDPKNGW